MMLDVRWCQQKDHEFPEFARWMTILNVPSEEYVVWVCTDHREEIIRKLCDAVRELRIDEPGIPAEILQYDAWVKDPDRIPKVISTLTN